MIRCAQTRARGLVGLETILIFYLKQTITVFKVKQPGIVFKKYLNKFLLLLIKVVVDPLPKQIDSYEQMGQAPFFQIVCRFLGRLRLFGDI